VLHETRSFFGDDSYLIRESSPFVYLNSSGFHAPHWAGAPPNVWHESQWHQHDSWGLRVAILAECQSEKRKRKKKRKKGREANATYSTPTLPHRQEY
jgi:hypothetical protein